MGELGVVGAPVRLAVGARRLGRVPRGDGRVVVDVPGWRAPEASMAPLRWWLRSRGWDARGWGLGVNRGDPETDRHRLVEVLEEQVAHDGRPVGLVGWSLGGVVAREAARLRPDLVAGVVTYGTPVVGGPTHTLGAATYGPEECARIAALIEQLDATDPIRVPVTAVLTRRDGVVDWRACVDRATPDVTHVEVGTTHLGMGLDPAVWRTVGAALARAVA